MNNQSANAGNRSVLVAVVLMLGLSGWAGLQGIRFEAFNFIGAAIYLLCAYGVYRRNTFARYVSYAVLALHGAITCLVMASALNLTTAATAADAGAPQVFRLKVDVYDVMLRESLLLAVIVLTAILLWASARSTARNLP
ncbi:hypothetical protein ACQUQU_18345 [Thalassolituus sp. LLYu03]|uniref:hypothetical protein n=1 Tax=Thalassolituus sp. LLYu03 TaxID=3421656 RepID=UPI003D2892C2